jgi:Winged helix DNA-binding domain
VAHRDPGDDPQADRLSEEVLSRTALNRALLDRQLLLRRADLPVGEAIEHLVGLQAQEPLSPYYALWSRLEGFDPNELGRMLVEREVVRLTLFRGTIHLVTVRDALHLRPLVQVVIERVLGQSLRSLDRAKLAAAVHELLDKEALIQSQLGRRLIERGFGEDGHALGNAARVEVPLVQVPPRAVWGAGGQARYATLESWTGRELEAEPSLDEVVLRYLRGFGPASVMDMQNWSGLTRLKAVFERLGDRLVRFRDEDGRELFDLPEAPRPDPKTPAPVRFLGEYDNVLLGHADRRRIIPEDFPWRVILEPRRFVSNLLVDGVLRATWWIERDGDDRATLAIRPFKRLSKPEQANVSTEAQRMIDFAAPEAESRDVRFEDPV